MTLTREQYPSFADRDGISEGFCKLKQEANTINSILASMVSFGF